MKMSSQLLIAVVGNCASGKTTLVGNLTARGYRAINVPQEHSQVRRLWRYKKPDLLVLLSCSRETAVKRRPGFAWSSRQIEDQYRRLAMARQECDLYIKTDDLTRQEVADCVIELVKQKEASRNGKNSDAD